MVRVMDAGDGGGREGEEGRGCGKMSGRER